ncbi:outer membrane protein assembly factor BamE [Piscinibacter sp.]|jgi:outer membrane protein assembly factor BamE|uniref:outer membrane protein assembly factor BamE n=1 Tax=Piscinibacter sp. TaxID=1903157 RepID=UPI002F3F250E
MRSLPTPRWLVLALSFGGLAGCQSLNQYLQSSDNFLGVVTPYRVEVVQGNVVTKEQAAAIKPGMSRAQVRDILGSPLLTDVFHADRWDYVFTIRRQGAQPQDRRVVALFDDDKLKSLDTGGELPAEREFVAAIDTFKTSRNAPPLALTPEQIKALPVPAPAPADPGAVAAAASAPPRSYPPLEPR